MRQFGPQLMVKDIDLFEVTILAATIVVPLVFVETRIGVFNLSIVDPVVSLMFVGFLIRIWRRNIFPGFDKVDAVFLALVIWYWISLIRALDLAKSLAEVMWVTEAGLVFYMVRYGLNVGQNVLRIFKMICYGALFTSTLGLMVYLSSLRSGSGPILISSTLLNANSLSGYLIFTLPILIAFIYSQPVNTKIFWFIFTTIVSSALVTTSTRGGWLAISIAILAMSRFLKDKRLAVVLIIYIVFYSITFPQVLNRGSTILQALAQTSQVTAPSETTASIDEQATPDVMASKADDANGTDRIQLWKLGLMMWQDHPLVGVGTGNYIKLYDNYLQRNPQFDMTLSAREPHNSFVKLLAENGSVGLVLALVLTGLLAHRWIVMLKHNQGNSAYIPLIGATFGTLAFLLQSNTNSLLYIPRVAFMVWLVTGLVGRSSVDNI